MKLHVIHGEIGKLRKGEHVERFANIFTEDEFMAQIQALTDNEAKLVKAINEGTAIVKQSIQRLETDIVQEEKLVAEKVHADSRDQSQIKGFDETTHSLIEDIDKVSEVLRSVDIPTMVEESITILVRAEQTILVEMSHVLDDDRELVQQIMVILVEKGLPQNEVKHLFKDNEKKITKHFGGKIRKIYRYSRALVWFKAK